jgi:hypothetical protein
VSSGLEEGVGGSRLGGTAALVEAAAAAAAAVTAVVVAVSLGTVRKMSCAGVAIEEGEEEDAQPLWK